VRDDCVIAQNGFASEPQPWVTAILTSSTSLILNMLASMALIPRRRDTKRN